MAKFPHKGLLSFILYPLSNTKGFTLLEILVAFSLIAVVSGVGFASFSDYSRRQVVYQTAEQFKESVGVARFNAISNVKQICDTTEQLNHYVIDICINGNPVCSSGEIVGEGDGYKLSVSCGSNPNDKRIITTKKFPDNVKFSTTRITGTPCGSEIIFGSVNSPSTLDPTCNIAITGFGVTIPVAIDAKGYVSF